MNVLDIIFLVILIIAAISGLMRGVIVQACEILGLLVGIWAAYRFSNLLARWIDVGETFTPVLNFIIVFLVVILVIVLIGRLFRKFFRKAGLGVLDRLGGMILAVLKWGVICSLLIGIFSHFNSEYDLVRPEIIAESKINKPFEKITAFVFPYITDAVEIATEPRRERQQEEQAPREESLPEREEADDFDPSVFHTI